jgi:hypothetical protein
MYTMVYVFIAGVVVVGVGIGLWLDGKLDATHQNIRRPSPFRAPERATAL